jgi:hypothetical protein
MTRAEQLTWLQSQPALTAAAAALGWDTAGDNYRVVWKEQAGVNGAATASITLDEAIPEADRGNVTAYVTGAKWRQSLVSVSADGYVVTLSAPYDGWTFSADDVIEVRVITGAEPTSAEGHYAAILDNAFRMLGVAETDLATYETPACAVQDALALLRYYALEAFTQTFALAVDAAVDDPQVSKKYNQRYKAYKELLDSARSDIEGRGYGVTAAGIEYGSLTLDIYEPCGA